MTEQRYLMTVSDLQKIANRTPFQHESLPPEMVADIKRLQKAFHDVYPLNMQEWIDGFRKDTNPEREVALWMRVATEFTAQAKGLSFKKRKTIFGNLLVSMMPPFEISDH